jgi:hypothetical protein
MEQQLEFFALEALVPPPPPAPEPKGPDSFTQRLLDTGLWTGSTWLLENNRTLDDWRLDRSSWGKWNLPSRAFRFPIEYFAPGRLESDACLSLNHPDLSEHPWVKVVEDKLGERIPFLAEDEFGRDRGAKWRYFHALDLATDDLFLSLIDECNFTEDAEAAAGASYGVRYGALSPNHARVLLTFFGHEEPEDRSAAALEGRIVNPSPMWVDDNGSPTKAPRFGMNDGGWWKGSSAFTTADRAWAWVHGLEDGWFKFPRQRARKDGHGGVGFITLTPEGLERMGFSPEAVDLRKDAE